MRILNYTVQVMQLRLLLRISLFANFARNSLHDVSYGQLLRSAYGGLGEIRDQRSYNAQENTTTCNNACIAPLNRVPEFTKNAEKPASSTAPFGIRQHA